jgi:hypothetical protein
MDLFRVFILCCAGKDAIIELFGGLSCYQELYGQCHLWVVIRYLLSEKPELRETLLYYPINF